MCMRIFTIFILICAIAVGLATQLPRDMLEKVITFRLFFDASLPILAFGAIVKYLCSNFGKCGNGCKCGSGCSCGCCAPKGACSDKTAK